MKDIELRRAIDRAIDEGDTEEIERLLSKTPDTEDMPRDFALSIISRCKENKTMKKLRISKIGVVAAAVVLCCGAVGGAVLVKHYSMEYGNKYIQVASNEDIDEKELAEIAKNSAVDIEDIESGKVIVANTKTYSSVEEAEKEMGIKAVLPAVMPELKLDKVEGCVLNDNRKDMYIEYGSPDTKYFGITLGYEKLGQGESSVTTGDIDEGSLGSYTSAKGYKFDTLDESGKGKTAHIYTTHVGDYEYSLVFSDFDEKEMEKVVDSVDLESYR